MLSAQLDDDDDDDNDLSTHLIAYLPTHPFIQIAGQIDRCQSIFLLKIIYINESKATNNYMSTKDKQCFYIRKIYILLIKCFQLTIIIIIIKILFLPFTLFTVSYTNCDCLSFTDFQIDLAQNVFLLFLFVQGAYNKFPDFFRMGTFIDSTHMKLQPPSK